MPALTQIELDRHGCDDPDCDHDHMTLWLRGQCHPGGGLEVAYVKAQGVMVCQCMTCENVVAVIEVARGGSLN